MFCYYLRLQSIFLSEDSHLKSHLTFTRLPGDSVVKNPPVNAGDVGSIPGSERSSGEGNGNSHQNSCLGNSMDRGAWQAIVHGVAKELDMTKQLNNNFTKNLTGFSLDLCSCSSTVTVLWHFPWIHDRSRWWCLSPQMAPLPLCTNNCTPKKYVQILSYLHHQFKKAKALP